MADRGKVIKGLECCKTFDCPEECPYLDETQITCGLDPMLDDAIELLKDDETQLIYRDEIIKAHEDEIERLNELLKEQCEPTVPKQQEETRMWTVCGNCSQHLISKWIYCPYCGRKVQWDDT